MPWFASDSDFKTKYLQTLMEFGKTNFGKI